MKLRTGDVGLILGLAAVYIVAARIGLTFAAVAGFATLVWPPTGISIAVIVLLGDRLWPGVFLGAFVANLLTGATLYVGLGIGLGNTLEAVAGAYLLRNSPSFSRTLESVESTVVLILVALSCTILSASVGVNVVWQWRDHSPASRRDMARMVDRRHGGGDRHNAGDPRVE